MVEKFLPKPVKVSYQLTENPDNKITSEVMRFSSPAYENGNVKYELIKTSDIKQAGGQKFISYKTLKEVTGTTNKLKISWFSEFQIQIDNWIMILPQSLESQLKRQTINN